MTSSPGPMPRASRASSRAWVQDVVRSTRAHPEGRRQAALDPPAEGTVPANAPREGSRTRRGSSSSNQGTDRGMAGLRGWLQESRIDVAPYANTSAGAGHRPAART